MWNAVFLTAALALGQPGDPLPDIAPATPPSFQTPGQPPVPRIQSISVTVDPPAPALADPPVPADVPAPTITAPPAVAPAGPPIPADVPVPAAVPAPDDALLQVSAPAAEPPPPSDQPPTPILITAPLLPTPPPVVPPAAPAPAAAPTSYPPYLFMQAVQGTYIGDLMHGERLNLYGWTEGSYTYARSRGRWPILGSSPTNDFMMNQNWLVFERTVVTTGTTEPTFGFHTAWILPGTDARFTPSRGLLNHQHGVGDFTETNYPIDMYHGYFEGFFPTIGQGLDVKIGKSPVPYGAEVQDAANNALYSHSYIYFGEGAFTHTGVQGNLILTPEWAVEARVVLGDDIAQFYGAQPTFVGALTWTQPGGRNTAAVSVVAGSGRFDLTHNQGNINIADLVFVHNFNPVLKYTLNGMFGYENNVGADAAALTTDGVNTAIWYAAAQYLSYTVSPRLTANGRLEFFDDQDGLRTGFKGMYTEATAGVTYKPRPDIWIRPEIRYDYNGSSRPYNNNHDSPQHDQLSAACDLILRW